MALNLVYRNIDSKNRVEDLGKTLAPGVPALSTAGLPVVTVTGSGDYTVTETGFGGVTISGIPAGGEGLEGQQVTLAFDGTWEFEVTGATASTAQGTEVFIDPATNALALTGTDSYGYVDYPVDYDRTRGLTPVRIGA